MASATTTLIAMWFGGMATGWGIGGWVWYRYGRRDGRHTGYTEGLRDLKTELFAVARQRLDDGQPTDVGTLAEHVMDTINSLIHDGPSCS